MRKIPDFEKEYIKSVRENDRDVIDLLDKNDGGIIKKINNFSEKHGFSIFSIKKKIKDDPHFRAFFAKDPAKQKIHENIVAEFIKSLPGVTKFKQLSHGDTALLRGALISKKDIIKFGGQNSAKTIDFVWETKGKKIIASHKYTKEGGGAQDNQYADLQEFIREANQSNLPNTFFLAIADGDYYKKVAHSIGIKKIDRLKKIANRENVFTLSVEELETWLSQLS